MRKQQSICLIVVLCCSLLPAFSVARGGDALDTLRDAALSPFTPLQGIATAVDGKNVYTDLTEEMGLRTGIRLTVVRKGEPFLHPVTKEPLGLSEQDVGTAQAVEPSPEGFRLVLIRGEAREGDILRLSSAKVRALFYQSASVDWKLSQEYFQRLRDSERFELIEAAPGDAPDSEIAEEARQQNAEIAIVLASGGTAARGVLRQRLIWAEEPAEISSAEVTVEEKALRKMDPGEEYFSPREGLPVLSFSLPSDSRLVASGDFDGDGEQELVLSSGSTLSFHRVGASLGPALGGVKVQGEKGDEHIWLDTFGFPGEGRDAVVLVLLRKGKVVSRILGFRDGAFAALWEGDIFISAIRGNIYGQEEAAGGGYGGRVFLMEWTGEGLTRSADMSLPEGVNIYSFNVIRGPGGEEHIIAYDGSGHITLYGPGGRLLWRSPEEYGGIAKSFDVKTALDFPSPEKWHVGDRIVAKGGSAIALKRARRSGGIRGLGYSESLLIGLAVADGTLRESVILSDLSGSVYDYAVSGGRLFVLAGSYRVNPLNILKGRGIFTSKLQVYALNGT